MTSNETIAKTVNYPFIYGKVNELLIVSRSLNQFPFKVAPFIKEISDIRLCKFSRAREKYGISMDSFGSEAAVILKFYGAFIIFYNQDDPDYRIRFSLMHEFGHYILGHEFNLEKNDPLYQKQELEANCFAAQILMPEQIVDL